MSAQTSLWIRRFDSAPESAARLVCFPHAGGAATFFFPLSRLLAPAVQVLAVQYPGRQERRSEPCVEDLHRMADLVAAELLAGDLGRVALFGHSMGSLVAFEVGLRLTGAGADPVALFASGHRPPALHHIPGEHRFDDDELIADLKRLAGTGGAFFDDEEALRMILPCLRGDYRASVAYKPAPGRLLGCPVVALTGDADPEVTVEEAGRWAAETTGGFSRIVYPGHHFYLAEHVAPIAAEITARLAAIGAGDRR